jgi:NRAMP (natural resistance-associated macrophage protein)-like metal ion transporter
MASCRRPNPGTTDPSGNGAAGPAESGGEVKPGPARQPHPVTRFLKTLGPGLVTGASDDDPSGIGTYAMAGASFGYATLWTVLVTFPLMAAVQFICAKIGLVCRCGLAGVMRRHYPRLVVYPAVLGLVLANTINAAADIAAVAAGVNLLLPVPIAFLILPIGLTILAFQVWGSYRLIARTFKWLTLSLFAYIGAALLAGPDWGQVLRGTFLPTLRLDSASLAMLVAILGTTISPYLFFWQADQEAEERRAHGRKRLWRRKGASDGELRYAAWDVNTGMFLSSVVMYSIILATAATLHQRAGGKEIATAADAAEALRPLAGDGAFLLMALGLIGSGVLAVPILTGSGAYAVAEMAGWKCGLDEKPGRAPEFYLVMGASTIAALLMDYLGIDVMKALFWTAVINGFLSPPLLVIILLIANNRAVMGKRVNGPLLNVLGWATTALMFTAAGVLAWTWFRS